MTRVESVWRASLIRSKRAAVLATKAPFSVMSVGILASTLGLGLFCQS